MSRALLSLLPMLLAACTTPSSPADSSGRTDAPVAPGQPTPGEVAAPPVEPASDEVVAEVAAGFNAFGLELYRELASAPGNRIMSPASVALALAMTHAGAKGETAAELERALHYGRPAPQVQQAVATMQQAWQAVPKSTELRVANRLFGEATVPFEPSFIELTGRMFGAPLEAVDFKGSAEPARVRINEWVEDRTHERIRDLLPAGAVDASTRLVLVNALYFKAQWQHPFAEHATAPAPFFTAGGPVDAPTMRLSEELRHAAVPADGVELVELPYADGRFAMTVVLPTAKDGLAATEAKLDAAHLDAWTSALERRAVEVALPKLKLSPTESLSLSPALRTLGVEQAFTPQADFSGMTRQEPGVLVSEVFHKGFIEVDENGTEAAAATAVVMAEGAAAPSRPPHRFVADHPFLFFVRDTRSGMVMFMGRVADPTAS